MAKIISNKDDPELTQKLKPFNLGKIEQEAKNVIQRAKEESEKILKQAKIRAEKFALDYIKIAIEKGKKKGTEEGYKIGKKKGYEDSLKKNSEEIKTVVDAISKIIEEFEKQKMQIFDKAERDLIKFSIAVAEKVVKKEVQLDQNVIFNNLKRGIELTTQKTDIEIKINPEDKEGVEKFIPDLKTLFTAIKTVNLISDENVKKGGCVIQTKSGIVDLGIKNQLEKIEKELL